MFIGVVPLFVMLTKILTKSGLVLTIILSALLTFIVTTLFSKFMKPFLTLIVGARAEVSE
jgi:multisubunit Na+/H+ antiporter MnhF subunit